MPSKTMRGTALALLVGAATAVSPALAADHLRAAKPAAIGFGFSMLDVGISAGIFRNMISMSNRWCSKARPSSIKQ